MYEAEFTSAAMIWDCPDRYGRGYDVVTAQTGASRWETRVYNDGYAYDGPIDRAVTHCADLVFDQHENMVARYS